MTKGRSLDDFLPLRPGEERLLQACRVGEEAKLGDSPPELCIDDNRIRGSFLRFLALGGDDQASIHEHGVQIRGAWIAGVFDLEATRVPSNLTLYACKFDTAPNGTDLRRKPFKYSMLRCDEVNGKPLRTMQGPGNTAENAGSTQVTACRFVGKSLI
jgi:hypothetical protein